jgi:hypothetical protein
VLDIAVTSALAAIIVVRHFANLRRLVRGEELGLERRAEPDASDDATETA